MDRRKFKRYIVLDVEAFKKIENGYFNQNHLSSIENDLMKVIRNTSLSTPQRLFLYKELLFRNTSNNNKMQRSLKPTPLDIQSPTKKISMKTQTDLNPTTNTASSSSQTKYVLKKDKGTEFNEEDFVFATQKEPASTSQMTTTTATGSTNQIDDREQSFFDASDRDLNEFDLEGEKNAFIKSIHDMSDTPVDLKTLSFRNLEDPDKEFVIVENKNDGTVFSVDKSDSLITRQRNQSEGRKGTAKKRNADELIIAQKKKSSPSKLRSGVTFSTYEDVMRENTQK